MKKAITLLLAFVLAVSMMFGMSSCGAGGGDSGGEQTNTALDATTDETATDMEMWVFVELHGQFYSDMLTRWNDDNPDKQININMTTYPYGDMHDKLTIAVQSGTGAPDMVDVEIGRFPNYLQGEVPFFDMTSYVDPYRDDIVPSRLSIYGQDGKNYGIPTHVGAAAIFYNTEILEAAGVDYTQIVTWDDYMEAGLKVVEAGYIMGAAETNNTSTLNAMLAQQGSDLVDDAGNPQVNTPEAIKAMTMIRDLYNAGVDQTIPGGHVDTEEAYGVMNNGEYASAIRPLWFMSRYTNYMEDLAGKIAIAPIPVFEEGQPRSYGGGGTGTVVMNTSENAELAAEWLAWAKLSELGNEQIWNVLGFDPCNTSLWSDEELTHNPENVFVQYFANNPFDMLLEVQDEIEEVKAVVASPVIGNVLGTTTLIDIIEYGVDPTEALNAAQEQIENELR